MQGVKDLGEKHTEGFKKECFCFQILGVPSDMFPLKNTHCIKI